MLGYGRRGSVVVLGMGAALLAICVLIITQVDEPVDVGSGKLSAGVAGCDRPYSPTSPWNTPIGASPPVDDRSVARIHALGGPLTSDPTQYTYPLYEVDRRTPVRSVRVNGVFSAVTPRDRLRIRRHATIRMPIPPAAQAAGGKDAQIIMVNRRTGDEWGAWRAHRDSGGWVIQNGYHYNTHWDGVPPRDAQGRPFASRGAGVPYLAGLVRRCEIQRGWIDHALAFAYDYPTSRYVFPATKSDGRSNHAADLPEGSRLQLDPELSDTDLRRIGCLDACLTIAHALQRYGMYVIDNSGRPKLMMEYEGTAHWRGRLSAETVGPIPMQSLRVIALR